MKKTNVFTVIGVVVAALAAVAGVAYAVYYFMNKRCLCDSECYEFDCEDCTDDCCDCPAARDFAEDADTDDIVE